MSSFYYYTCRAVFIRDLQLGIKNAHELLTPVVFFLLIISLFPLGLNLSNTLMLAIAPSIIWIAALLATIQVMERLFKTDFEDGSLEQFILSGTPFSLIILAKIMAHWCLTGLPLTLISPILGLMMFLPPKAAFGLSFLLLVSTPILSLIGAMGVALTVGLRRSGLLLSIIVLPLYIPILIFGTQGVISLIDGQNYFAYLLVFISFLILTSIFCPLISAFSLKINIE